MASSSLLVHKLSLRYFSLIFSLTDTIENVKPEIQDQEGIPQAVVHVDSTRTCRRTTRMLAVVTRKCYFLHLDVHYLI